MAETSSSTPWVVICVFTISFSLGLYFTFAAVQGDFGILRRAEVNHDIQKLQVDVLPEYRRLAANLIDRFIDEFEAQGGRRIEITEIFERMYKWKK